MKTKKKTRIPLIIWYYRILGITFGGLSVGSDGVFREKRLLKIFGYIYASLVTIMATIGTILTFTIKDILDIYEGGFPIIYYIIIATLSFYVIVALSNLWFFQHNGMKLLIIIKKYKYSDYEFSKVFLMVCFVHIVAVVFLYSIETIVWEKTAFNIIYNFFLKFFFYPIFWAISMFTWFLSILIKDHLVNNK
jgi:MFS family permease